MNPDTEQAGNILKDFISDYYSVIQVFVSNESHSIPKLTDQKRIRIKNKIGAEKLYEVDKALDVCLNALLSETRKKIEDRTEPLQILFEPIRIVLSLLGEIHYSARRLFQYALADFMAMKKSQWKASMGEIPKMGFGNVIWRIAGHVSQYGSLADCPVQYMFDRMNKAIELSVNESDKQLGISMRERLNQAKELQNKTFGSWESCFLDMMESRLMRCGFGKVYRDGKFIYVNSGSADYKVIRYSKLNLLCAVKGNIKKAVDELPPLPKGCKVCFFIDEISTTLKKIYFVMIRL